MIINYSNNYEDYKKAYEGVFKVSRNMKCIVSFETNVNWRKNFRNK